MTRSRDADDLSEWSSILERASSGSAHAFEVIYLDLSPAVAGYLRASAVADVEGLTNEVFLQVLKGLPRFRGDWPAFRSWVFTIAHHRMVDEVRRATRRPRLVPIEAAADGPIGNAELDALDVLSDDRLRQLLDGLSDDQRHVLVLRVVADLTLEETAAALHKTVGAVKSLQHRALATLRRAMDAEEAAP